MNSLDGPILMAVPKPMQTEHSAVKCDVIGPKNHVPMGTKVGKVPNKLYKGYLHKMWTLRRKFFLAPWVPRGDPKSLELIPLGQKSFFCSNPLNKVPLRLPHPQNNFWGSNVDLFSNLEADFEAEMLSP